MRCQRGKKRGKVETLVSCEPYMYEKKQVTEGVGRTQENLLEYEFVILRFHANRCCILPHPFGLARI